MAAPTSSNNQLVVEYPLPAAITVGADALGNVTTLTIASRRGQIHLPRLQGDDPVLRWPAAVDGLTDEQLYGWHDQGLESPWGYPTTWGLPVEAKDDVLAVTRVALTFPDTNPDNDRALLKLLMTAVPTWFDSAKDWCEVLHHQDLNYKAPRRRIELGGISWLSWYQGKPERVPSRFYFDFEHGRPMSRVGWEEVVELVSAGREPPPSALLLRDVRNARDRGEYRSALIDAATALEMALFAIIEGAQRSATPSISGRHLDHLRKRGTLLDLVKDLRALGLLPTTFDDDLISLRNEVVHKSARAPTEEEVDAMLKVATEAAERAWPTWPRLS